MIKKLLFFVLVSGLSPAEAQVFKKLYYNKDWILTSESSAVFVRDGAIDTEKYWFTGKVEDFTKEGKLVMSGWYARGEKNGLFTGYDATGRKLWEGSYYDGDRVGEWDYYYADGSLKSKMRFVDKRMEVITYNDSTGKALVDKGTGPWTAEYDEYQGEHIVVRGQFKNYKHDGAWTWSLKNGKTWSTSNFRKGKFVDGVTEADGQLVRLENPITDFPEDFKHAATEGFYVEDSMVLADYSFLNRIKARVTSNFIVCEVGAVPSGGMIELYKEVGRLLTGHYPPNARRNGIEGTVFIEFIVDKDGILKAFKVIKGPGGGLNEEALRVVIESQQKVKWRPGIQRRKYAEVKFTLPVMFRLG